ncbi:hypothetical protein BN1708_010069 [Verticillium longisporum]|uniref:Hexosyltransferase n=1 Tax=Verticillium longisporum TaxID=100787 RepID=A0A0G4KN41_VERLO|nr:hypothetical protein BN1708_010069 [Verticillium longisporum]
MAARRSWIYESVRGASVARSRMTTTRYWVMLSSFVAVALILLGMHLHSSTRLPPLYSKTGKVKPPPPYPDTSVVLAEGELREWVPPEMDALVHGVRASDGIRRDPKYKLEKFPYSPMDNPPHDDGHQRPWLGAVICSAWDLKRRMLIRYTWMKLYKDVPMDQRFVISNPGPRWMDVIRQENRTYGDLIVLDHLQEDDFTANTVKTIEFYRWLVEKSPRKYEFVTKMDTDLWVNARGYYDRQILPRLEAQAGNTTLVSTVDYTVIGQFYYDSYHKTSFPHGAIYTVTWDIVQLLPMLQDKFHVIAGEDVTMAWLLMRGKQKVNMAVLNEQEKFEFDQKDTRRGEDGPWARTGTDVTSPWHALAGKEALAIHMLKKDDEWLMVASVFDKNGLIDAPTTESHEFRDDNDKPGYPRPHYTAIPDSFWETDKDGRLLCNGVWKLEAGVGRDMKKTDDK